MNSFNVLKSSVLMAVAAVTLVACGGSGSSAPVNNASLSQSVATAVENGFKARQTSATAGPVQNNRNSDSDSGPRFDEILGVWIQPTETGYNYFLDQALTQAAGQSVTTTSEGGSLTTTRTTITAGIQTGFESTLEYGSENGTFVVRYSGSSPISGPFSYNVTNVDGEVQFTSMFRDADGVNRNYAVTYSNDGTSRVSYNTSQQFQYTLNYAADGSGTGTVTGSSAQLPATVTWDVNGDGKIVFADNSELQFRGFDFSF